VSDNAREIVASHLRAVEAGDWEKALSYLSEDYTMRGTIPFPISLFVKITKKEALRMHLPRKKALPDFKFNEKYLEEAPERVKIQVNLSGTHTGIIDYRGILRGIPVVPPTGKRVNLNSEYFEYFVRDGLIVKTIGYIPKDAGVKGLIRGVGAR
jgi:predicted ester cyclase